MTRATSMLEAAEVMCRHDNEMWKWGVRDKAVISAGVCGRFKLQLNTIVAALVDLMLIYDHNAGLVAELYGRVKESNC